MRTITTIKRAGSRQPRGLRAKVLLLCTSAIVAFAMAEVAIRLFIDVSHPYTIDGKPDGDYIYSEFRRRKINKYVPNRLPQQARTLKPNPAVVHGLAEEVNFTVDRFGFRTTHAISLKKPRGVIRIMAVGGSTTECKLHDDEATWTELLGESLKRKYPRIEMINAGLSGDSSRDHINVLAQLIVPFEPDIVLFLVGINDLELQMKPDYSILRHDRRSMVDDGRLDRGLLLKICAADVSHLVRLAVFARRNRLREDERGNPVQDATSNWIQVKREERRRLPLKTVETSRWPTPEYRQNLRTLIGICRSNDIQPVLITQAAIWGAPWGKWEEDLWVHPDPSYRVSHDQLWEILEGFNNVMRSTAAEADVVLVDLARLLPKTSEIFWDDDHFTVVGCQKVADVIASELEKTELLKAEINERSNSLVELHEDSRSTSH